MPQRVYNNVVGQRVKDNDRVAEDVTSIALPTVSHSTSTIKASGMAMDVEMPDTTHLESMEFGISHNNGVNCNYLSDPGKHFIEVRIARQRYDVSAGEIQHEPDKFRLTVIHKSTEKGTIETGNPYGSTDKFSVLRYEEELNGEIVTIVDAMAGILRWNGKDYTDPIEKMLG